VTSVVKQQLERRYAGKDKYWYFPALNLFGGWKAKIFNNRRLIGLVDPRIMPKGACES